LTVLKQFEKDRIIVNDKDKQICGTLGFQEIAMMYSGLPTGILYDIRTGDTIGNIVKSLDQVPEMVANMTRQGVKPNVLRETLGKIYESTVKKIISLTLLELDMPDVKFAFMSLGSTARHEMTLFSDQDNALIIEDLPEDDVQKVRLQLLKFTDMVCAKLNDGGYPYCPGGIMSSNPKWCLTQTEWKKRFSVWISKASPQSILDIHVFFDIELSYGDKSLVTDLKEFINLMIKNNPGFLVHFAKNLLGYKDPIGLLGNIRSETKDGVKSINIKESLMPIVNFARIYSLRYNVSQAGTKQRLSILKDTGVLSEGSYNELMYIFNHLWHLRFYNQVFAHQGLRKVNDEFELNGLTDNETQPHRTVHAGISKFQAKINYDFLGGVSNM
jgi:CBS domain-containing protein